MKEKLLNTTLVACALLTIIIIWFLLKSPVIGVADNGEFYNTLTATGLYHSGATGSDYIEPTFGIMEGTQRSYGTTHTLIIGAAVWLNKLLYSKTVFDIRFLSLIYSFLLLLAVYMSLKAVRLRTGWLNWLYAGFIVFSVCDIGYLAYLNTLYDEAASYIFLSLAIAAYLYTVNREKPSFWSAIVFFIAAAVFSGIRQQYLIISLATVYLGIRLIPLKSSYIWRSLCAILSAVILITSLWSLSASTNDSARVSKYHSVFYGILKNSKNIDADLTALGLNSKLLSPLVGKPYYEASGLLDPKGELMQREFFNKLSYTDIARFYALNPPRLVEKMGNTANAAFRVVQDYLGSYQNNSGMSPRTPLYGIWSRIKLILPNNLVIVLTLLLVFLYFVTKERKALTAKARRVNDLMYFIGFVIIYQLITTYPTYGEADLSKHMFLFNLAFDLMFAASVAWGSQSLIDRREKLQKMYGVKQ